MPKLCIIFCDSCFTQLLLASHGPMRHMVSDHWSAVMSSTADSVASWEINWYKTQLHELRTGRGAQTLARHSDFFPAVNENRAAIKFAYRSGQIKKST